MQKMHAKTLIQDKKCISWLFYNNKAYYIVVQVCVNFITCMNNNKN